MFVRNKKLLAAAYFIAIFGAVLFVQRASASAATITVSGGCSFENAVASANTDSNTGGCTGSGSYGDDTVSVPSGTWALTSQPMITDNLTITGSGMSTTTIDGDGSYNVVYCDGSANVVNVSVSGLKIINTPQGGIGGSWCNFDISRVELSNATGFGIFADLSKDNTNFTLSVSDTYIHDSVLSHGIALAVDATTGNVGVETHINRVTIVNNTVQSPLPYFTGILINDKYGTNNNFQTWITNSTISNGNNSMGIYSYTRDGTSASLGIINNTIVGNQPGNAPLAGGVNIIGATSAQIQASLQNNIFANSSVNCYKDGGSFVALNSLGYNLADDATCGTAATGDQFNVATIQDFLGPLQNNGGLVPTMELLAGSTAIDAGSSESGLETDARGIARPQGSAYDIGAFEVQQAGSGNSSSGGGGNADQNTSNNSSGGGLAETGAHLISPVLLLLALSGATYGTIRVARKKNLYRSINR